jgi:hypothetical protein
LFYDVLHARCSAFSSASAHISWYNKRSPLQNHLKEGLFCSQTTHNQVTIIAKVTKA